jgi:outer membrane protein TolC
VAVGTLVSGPSAIWSVGATSLQILFDAGKRAAATDEARGAYEESIASYRQTVLGAFQEVEDDLAALRILAAEAKTQDEAVKSARQSVELATRRYKGGIATYLEVVTAQSTALANERTAVEIRGRRMVTCVPLIKALGGGWEGSLSGSRSASTPSR